MDSGTAVLLGASIGAAAGVAGQMVASHLERGREREARHQARLERTYERIMRQVDRSALTVMRTEPDFWFGDKAPEPPAPISDDEMIELEAQIGLFGSEAVRRELRSFAEKQREFNSSVFYRRAIAPDFPSPGVSAEQMMGALEKVRSARRTLLDQTTRLEQVAREELQGRPGLIAAAWARVARRLPQRA